MSSKRFEIDIGLNASGVVKGAGDGKKALSDLEEAVGEVGDESTKASRPVDTFATKLVEAARKAGKADDEIKDALRQMGLSAKQAERAVEDVGDEFRDTGREGARGAEKLEDSLRDVQKQSEKTERSVDDIGDAGDKGFRKLGDAAEETSDELKQNLGETFSSFRGDLEDIPQIAQDVFGGLAGSVGTLPAAFALAAGAAGIGLLINGFEQLNEKEEERKQRISEWAAAYIGGLGDMETALADFASIEEIYTDTDRYAEASKNAELWGTDVSTAVNAMAGDMTALGVVEDNLNRKTAELAEVNIRNAAATGEGRDRLRELETTLRDGQTAYSDLTGEMEAGRAIADQYSDSLLQIIQNSSEAGVEVDELGNKVFTLPDGKQIMIDAKTGKATEDVSKFKGDTDGVIDHLNSRDITLAVRAAVQDAENEVNRFISRNNGRTIQLHGRFNVSPIGGDL